MKIIPLTHLLVLHWTFGVWNEVSCRRTSASRSFEELVKSKHYVDKSNLLKVLLDDKFENSVLIIIAPKRFGKSKNMQMMKTFCEIQDPYTQFPHARNIDAITDTSNYRLFTDEHFFGKLKINRDRDFMRNNFGKYPVIQMNFGMTMIPIKSYEDALDVIKYTVANAFEDHQYLMQSPALNDSDKIFLDRWLDPNKCRELTEIEITNGVSKLASCLEKHFKRKSVILFDEYDMMIRSALESGSMSEEEIEHTIALFATFLSKSFKDQSYYRVALLTGVSYIASAGLNERVPNLKSFLFARNTEFCQYYGFSKNEMEYLFEIEGSRFNNSMKKNAYRYYDGYIANNELIFTPEPIIEFLETGELKSYWSKSSPLSQYYNTLRIAGIRRRIFRIVECKSIEMEHLQKITINDALMLRKCTETETDLTRPGSEEEIAIFLNFLLDTGYLKITSRNNTHLRVEIPNSDVRDDVERLLKKFHFYVMIEPDTMQYHFEQDFLNSLKSISDVGFKTNIETMADSLNELTYRGMKNLGIPHFKEADLDELLRMILFVNGIKYYAEAPLYETGLDVDQRKLIGFIDILITKLPNVYVIIELKYGREDSEKLAKEALNQIKEKYIRVMGSSEYSMTQKAYLLLGIAVREDTSITIAANFVHIHKHVEETVIIPGKLVDGIKPSKNGQISPKKPRKT